MLPRKGRRGRIEIWTDILSALEAEGWRAGTNRPTRVRSHANLPHTRFWEHVAHLEARGLVSKEPFTVTDEGRAFLRRAQALREAAGIEPPGDLV